MDPVTALKTAQTVRAIAKFIPWRKVAIFGAGFSALIGILVTGAATTLMGASNDDFGTGNGTCVTINSGVTSKDLNASQIANAAVIVAVGQQLGIPARGWIVGIATAMQESQLDNTLTPAQSDRDSAGMFQQRTPWGPLTDRMDPAASTRMFYTGGQTGQPGLLDKPGWESLPVTIAAQQVQVSAFPNAYAKWETLATETVAKLTGGISDSADASAPSPSATASASASASPSASAKPAPISFADLAARCGSGVTAANWTPLAGATAGEKAVNAAAKWLGTDYSWGGGTLTGPGTGIAQGAGTIGFDCSALVRYSWYQATGVQLPRTARVIAANTTQISAAEIQAGDILNFDTMGGGVTHDGLADGRGGMIHAPKTGSKVSIVPNVLQDKYYAPRLISITRPAAAAKEVAS